MNDFLIFNAGSTSAAAFATSFLQDAGIAVTDNPSENVTHLLLDTPSFEIGGQLRGGGDFHQLLASLPEDIIVCGGKLDHPALQPYRTLDLLAYPDYLAENAYITAEAALKLAMSRLPCLLRGCEALILGWGRIGKCLGQLLKDMGAIVTIAARKETDRAMLRALGYATADVSELTGILPQFRLIFNTAPQMLLPESSTALCRENCVKIDLASQPGLAGPGIITARGLPGLHKPESSGRLIAKTLLHFIQKEDSL